MFSDQLPFYLRHPLFDRHHFSLADKNLGRQNTMYFLIPVSTAIGQNG
jgi:hypothetical protein